MHKSIQFRLSLNTLIVLLAGMGLAGGLAWLSAGRLYLETQRENLLAQAELTASTMQGLPVSALAPEYTQTTNVQPGVHTHLLNIEGMVVLGIPLPPGVLVRLPAVENADPVSPMQLLQRPEIQKALHGEADTAVRRVESARGQRVLYAAAPIISAGGDVTGIVYIATPLPAGGLPPGVFWQWAGALSAAVLLAGLAGAILARRIARPLEDLARAADDVAAGQLDRRVPTGAGIRELDSLGESFNSMTASLRQTEQARSAFIADVTHELRTPLTVIKGTIETLEDGALDDIAGRGPLLKSMAGEAERLIRLVNDLLVLARADAGALKLDLKPLDLARLARKRCEQLAPLASRRRVKLHVIVSEAGPEIYAYGDPDRLAQVLDNLLDNAIRHTADGSEVMLSLAREKAEIRCEVRDRGPGIASEHLPFVFERFYRVEASRRREGTGGAGLGLAIVRSLVLAQGGRVAIDSLEGRGTAVTFWLPADGDCHATA